MNLVDLSLIVLIALTVFVGIKRGLLISLLSALRFIVSIPLSFFVGNNYNEIIYKNYIRQYVLKYVDDKLSQYLPAVSQNSSAESTRFVISLLSNTRLA